MTQDSMLRDVHWSSSKMHSKKKESKVLSVTDDWLTASTSKIKGLKELGTASLGLNLSLSIVPCLRERISQPFNRFSDTFSKSAVRILIRQRIIQRWGHWMARMTHSEVATPSPAHANRMADAAKRRDPLQNRVYVSCFFCLGLTWIRGYFEI